MSEPVARLVLMLVAAHLAAGLIFALAFHALGMTRVDPSARGAGLGFRLLVTPGLVALWPLMAWRWHVGAPAAPADPRGPRRLRRAHQVIVQWLAILLPLLLAAALASRGAR